MPYGNKSSSERSQNQRSSSAQSGQSSSKFHHKRSRSKTSFSGEALSPRTARNVAWDALLIILSDTKTTDVALDRAGWKQLSPTDRAFVKRLLLTTLRFFYPLWNVLTEFLSRPLEDSPKGEKLKGILLLGICELLVLKTPPHAAISSALKLAETDKDTFPIKGLLNGVLRSIDRERDRANPILERSSILPSWLHVRWKKIYGTETLSKIEAALRQTPSLDLTLKDPQMAESLAAALDAAILPSGSLRVQTLTDIRSLEGYDTGAWWVQNAAAALAVPLLGTINGQDVLDVCAAPAGKTMQLLARGASVTALDVSEERLKRVEENLKRMNFAQAPEILCADATTWQPSSGRQWDHILIDAPCSATGTIRRHPEMLLQRDAETLLENITSLQKDILTHMSSFIKTGGRLVYVTCSLEPEEGEQLINTFLQEANGTFERESITAQDLSGLSESVTPEGDARILPHHGKEGGLDGFFISRLKRVKAS